MGRLRLGVLSALIGTIVIATPGTAPGRESVRAAAPAPPRFTIRDLGTLGGERSQGFGVNNRGDVVGDSTTSTGAQHGFLYTGGAMQDLGTLPGGAHSRAWDINESRQAAGYSAVASGARHAALFSGGAVQDLGTLPGGSSSEAYAVNNRGEAAGYATVAGGVPHAAVFSNGTVRDLGTLPGGTASIAFGINEAGFVVGYSTGTTGLHAFLYNGTSMIDLGAPTSSSASLFGPLQEADSIGMDVNRTTIAGSAGTTAGRVGVLWGIANRQGSTFAFPGRPFMEFTGLNAAGQAVGVATAQAGGDPIAVLYLVVLRQLVDLNVLIPPGLGWRLTTAWAISDQLRIVGRGLLNNVAHAFILIPPVCHCAVLSAKASGLALGEPDPEGRVVVKFHLNWTLGCAAGVGATCKGKIKVHLPGGKFQLTAKSLKPKRKSAAWIPSARLPRTYTVTCSGKCETERSTLTNGDIFVSGKARHFLADERANKSFSVHIDTSCGGKKGGQTFVFAFGPRGFSDPKRSDLNGNGIPDGKEKK